MTDRRIRHLETAIRRTRTMHAQFETPQPEIMESIIQKQARLIDLLRGDD